MRKLIFTSVILTLSLALRTLGQTQGQLRGDSIFASTNVLAGVAPGDAKTNSVSASQTRVADGTLVGFDKLAGFSLKLTEELVSGTNAAGANTEVNALIPVDVRALDHRIVSVEGFMVPVEFEKENTVEFILAQAPFGCCYGTPPQIQELIKVRVKSPGVLPILDKPARAHGTFHVGAEREDGILASIYRMDADTVTVKP